MTHGNDRLGTCLILGANGQVGHEVSRDVSPVARVIRANRRDVDLTSANAIRAVIRSANPSLIINAAAYTAVDQAETDTDTCWSVNATAVGIIAEEAARIGAGVIHYSTDYVFDGTKGAEYSETDAPAPISTYGRSKLAGERMIADTGVPHIILRTSWVYGARGRNFPLTMLALARQRDTLRVVADQVGAPTWSRAIGAATASLIARAGGTRAFATEVSGAVSGVYHLASGGSTTWHGFALAALALDPFPDEQVCTRVEPITTIEYPTPAPRPRNSLLNCEKIESTFGIALPDWSESLRLAFEKAH
ncbi:MAG: dTDP-4-dehydrorhamnose reductase [bacterium]